MKILLASSELFPFSKTGGLADMVASLARALAQAGHEVRVATPLYRGIREKFPKIQQEKWEFNLSLGNRWVKGGLWSLQPEKGLKIYFVDQPEFFDRAGIYHEQNISYADNAERYIFFSKCVVHLARYLAWRPDIIHVHDWQVSLVPAMLQQLGREGWGNPPPSCLTIHNLAYQGVFPAHSWALTGLGEDFFTADGAEFFGMMNCLKAGVAFANLITTVSPRYAREITTPEFGCGLDGLLRRRIDRLAGILNGVDYQEWNPAKDPLLFKNYSRFQLAGKRAGKAALQKFLGLPAKATVPLFGTVSRLADQKGVDIQLGALEEMLNSDLQFVLLGSGSPEYERAYQDLAKRYPQSCSIRIGYDEALAHRIEAGCDFFLMPSYFEPCGLNQMYSLRYGTIPIVRAVGGLDDSVIDFNENPARADGIKFYEYSVRALTKAIRKAMAMYSRGDLVDLYRQNGMKRDFSWKRAVASYEAIYQTLIN